jgi:acyl-CoA thioesterase FadM
MTGLVRLIRVVTTARGRGRVGPLDECVLSFRVMPADLDINRHMNNGRYLQLMDLGRFDYIIRAGVFPEIRRRRWMPLVGSETIRFRRSLPLFRTHQLHTRLVYWDDKWFFFEQRFTSQGDLIATAMVKCLLRGQAGNVSPADVLAAGGHRLVAPAPVAGLERWNEADQALFEVARGREIVRDGLP